jgi:hypothetical protein
MLLIGDLEHTHLVKGLDFALLNKVRSEIKKPDAEDGKDAKARYFPPQFSLSTSIKFHCTFSVYVTVTLIRGF